MSRMEFLGQLTAAPFADRPKLSGMGILPLMHPKEYGVIRSLPYASMETPILLNFTDTYELLFQIINEANDLFPEIEFFLVALKMPGMGRIPFNLFDPKIILCVDPTFELSYFEQKGRSVLAINHSFIRHPLEVGDNHIDITLTHVKDPLPRFTKLIEALKALEINERRG